MNWRRPAAGGLRVLQRNNKRITGKNWMQKGESLVDRGGTDHPKLGKINFAGMGTMMIKKLAPAAPDGERHRTA